MRFRGGNGFAAAPSAFWKPTERFAIESARRSGDRSCASGAFGACIRSRSVNLECRELARRNREGLFEFATPPFSFSSPLFVASSRRWVERAALSRDERACLCVRGRTFAPMSANSCQRRKCTRAHAPSTDDGPRTRPSPEVSIERQDDESRKRSARVSNEALALSISTIADVDPSSTGSPRRGPRGRGDVSLRAGRAGRVDATHACFGGAARSATPPRRRAQKSVVVGSPRKRNAEKTTSTRDATKL